MVGIGAPPLQNSLNNLSSSISSINGKISTINSDISTVETDISTLETNLSIAGEYIAWLYSELSKKIGYVKVNNIPDYANANNYLTIGSYTNSSSASMNTCYNFPTNCNAGTLYVFNNLAEGESLTGNSNYWEYFIQIFINLSGQIWTRSIMNNAGTMSYGSWSSLT